jgi:hypothetical protein
MVSEDEVLGRISGPHTEDATRSRYLNTGQLHGADSLPNSKEDEVSRTYRNMVRHTKFCSVNLIGSVNLEDLDVDGRTLYNAS